MNSVQNYILHDNYDEDIDPKWDVAIAADKFSKQCIPLIIKDDSNAFIELVSSPEFDIDGTLLQSRERFYISDYLYQPFFDELKNPTVLCVAAFFKAEKIVECILGLPGVDKRDAFHFACAGGSLSIVRMLFDQSECDLINKDGVRPITIASYFGNVDVVKYLWSHGCPIISQNENNSCVNKAAFNGQIEVLDFFREIDPKLIKKLKSYGHPIVSAAKGGQPECINYLIKYGEPSIGDIYGALLSACSSGSLSCVKILAKLYLTLKDESLKSKKSKRKKKKSDDDEDFNPYDKKKKKKKKKKSDDDDDSDDNNNDDQQDIENEKDQELLFAYYEAIDHFHLDVVHYLLSLREPQSMDPLLKRAVKCIKYEKLLDFIIPHTYRLDCSNYKKNENAHTNHWLKKSAPALKMAKYILMKYKSNPFTESLFIELTDVLLIQSAIYFLNEINFKFERKIDLAEGQIKFFQLALLFSNTKTIPMIKKILNNFDFNIFDEKFFSPMKNKVEGKEEEIGYIENQQIITQYNAYINLIYRTRKVFDVEAASFLIENHFPFYVTLCCSDSYISIFINLQFFNACVKSGDFYYAEKLLKIIHNSYYFYALFTLYEELNKKLNPNYDKESALLYVKLIDSSFNGAMNFINQFNSDQRNEKMKRSDFTIFNYQCKNESENEFYQNIMSLIKLSIEKGSTESEFALFLYWIGFSKEWIIEQSDDSLNPLISFAKTNISIGKYSFSNQRKHFGILHFYINIGIDVSPGNSYNENVWMNVIDNEQSWMAMMLIKFGNADKNLLLTVSPDSEEKMSLFDYALMKKVTSVLYILLKFNFYPDDSLIENDPVSIVTKLNDDKSNDNEDVRKKNLKIIALIYKYKKGNYDTDLMKTLMKELDSLIVPLKTKDSYHFF